MIVSNLQNSQRVEKLHPLFKQLFDYVKSHDLLHEELGTKMCIRDRVMGVWRCKKIRLDGTESNFRLSVGRYIYH